MTVEQAIKEGAGLLPGDNEDERRRTARLLLGHSMCADHATLLARWKQPVPADQAERYFALIERRSLGEPLQYIVGHQEFFGYDFLVTPAVLIPRPETEFLVEQVIKLNSSRAHQAAAAWAPETAASDSPDQPAYLDTKEIAGDHSPTIVDIGTGSGCIAVALAKVIQHARVIAIDISYEALEIARENARRNGAANQIEFIEGDLCRPLAALDLDGKVDFIVSNPPYVAARDRAALQPEVRDFEPGTALFGGAEGLGFHKRLLEEAPLYLKPGGYLICEIGYGQADEAAHLAEAGRWQLIEQTPDLQGIPRVLTFQRPL